ncbi:MAG: alkaline phosphatase D family protein [Xanthomonadales bacterium]|nr:alkaline phosphatase D family protein [Xanthomonadales bacterium]
MKPMLMFVALVISAAGSAQEPEPDGLAAGPMVGYSTMGEVAVWAQTRRGASVQLRYWPQSDPDQAMLSRTRLSFAETGFTVQLTATGLDPGTRYGYEVLVDGRPVARAYPLEFVTQPLWQWRGDPPPFRFALGSCNFVNQPEVDRPGGPYGNNHHIFHSVYEANPDFMLWLGDNTYLREVDWNSRSGIYRRYSHDRALPELQPLLGSVHHYAAWDDHDYGPNDADRSYWLKQVTREAFMDFWANPNYDVTGTGGITGTFNWNDAQIFLLDNRWFRSNNDRVSGTRQVFGPAQVQWLLDALKYSKATFKFVATSTPFLFDHMEGENHILIAPEERSELIAAITAEKIPGVIFLSGDLHYSQFVEVQRPDAYPLYEWTVSSLTAGISSPPDPAGLNVVPGSVVTAHNFGLVDITGPRDNRVARLKIVDHRGKTRWERTIRAAELCRPAACELGY